jgi:hypothetical protein
MIKLMAYFCYIHRKAGGAPYFEVLSETSQIGAMDRAALMLLQHADAVRAEVWDNDRLVFSLPHAMAGDSETDRCAN